MRAAAGLGEPQLELDVSCATGTRASAWECGRIRRHARGHGRVKPQTTMAAASEQVELAEVRVEEGNDASAGILGGRLVVLAVGEAREHHDDWVHP